MAAASSTNGATEANDCIGNLEHHIHRVFASVRVAGEDFVYCSSHELFARLDDHCDETTMSEMKPPLLIKGESGTGKTALLANWLHRREHALMRMRNNSDEFIFWHAVGCSRQSLNVNSLLRRLISDLKTRFELARQIPKSQERLSWELPRFLELASKKGKVIIVIDGLHRLKSNDGTEDGLAWLPLTFPPNIRVVLSVTIPESSSAKVEVAKPIEEPIETFTPFNFTPGSAIMKDREQGGGGESGGSDPLKSGKKSRILSELERRAIPSITMKALNGATCRSLVTAYIEKSISQESSKVAAGPFISGMLALGGPPAIQNSKFVTGFLLFESQVESLLKHELGGNPLFLRLFLRCLHFLCNRGHSLWCVFEDWIAAQTVQELISRILRTCESGFNRTKQLAQRDSDLSLSAGGLIEIKRIYSWHPAFRGEDLRSMSDVLTPYDKPFDQASKPGDQKGQQAASAGGSGSNVSAQAAAADDGYGADVDDLGKKESTALSNQVLQNLGDQQWITVERQVQRQLQRAVIDSRRVVEDAISMDGHITDRNSFVDGVLARIKHGQSLEGTETSVASASHPNVLTRARTSTTILDSESMVSGGGSHVRTAEDDEAASEDEDSWDDGSGLTSPAKLQSSPANRGKLFEPPTPFVKPSNMVQHALVHGESQQFPADVSATNSHASFANADPSDGFYSLPLYMRGGESVSGFGDLIGNALALLYVARQGLKEEELWKILCKLQLKKRLLKKMFQEKRDQLVAQEATVCKIATEVIKHQGFVEDVVMAEDITKSRYVPIAKLLQCVRRCTQQDVKPGDFRQLLEFMLKHAFGGLHNTTASLLNFEGRPFIEGDSIHYEQFMAALKKLNRRFRFGAATKIRQLGGGGSSPTVADSVDDEAFDDFHIPLGADEKEDAADADDDLLDAGTGTDVLGPVVEESLLNILCALGVLYSPENKVLILPSDSEPFRRTIFDRYILPRGGGSIQYWHNLIIQYFRKQINSLRKCEEMPWHLKICRKWTTLKDCLVDLKTFDLMFNNDLKDELMDYWRLLTEGPLYVVDPANLQSQLAQSGGLGGNTLVRSAHGGRSSFVFSSSARPAPTADDDDNGDNHSTLSNILKEIDEAQASKVPLKDLKRRMMRFQIQPFDVVEELNRSLESWVTAERPSPQWIHRIIMQISRFLLEFSKFTHSCPQFRRLGIEMAQLEKFNIIFDELKDVMLSSSSQGDGGDDSPGAGEGKAVGEGLTKAPPAVSKSKDKYFDGVAKQDVVRFPTPKMVSTPPTLPRGTADGHAQAAGNLYLYLRWIWIQFPWLALHPAATVAQQAEAVMDGSVNASDVEGKDDPAGEVVVDESVKHLLRVWNVKKSDPTVPVFTSSLNRKLAAIKPRTSLSSNLERNVEASCKKLYEELAAPSHIAQARLGIGITQRDKFRRTFQQEVELTKSIPFAYHGVKAMKNGSLFPSYNAFVKESNRKKMQADLLSNQGESDSVSGASSKKKKKKLEASRFDLDSALKSVMMGNAAQPSSFFLTELDDEIRRISHEEYIQNHRPDGSGAAGLVKDETDLETLSVLDRIARMKSIYNKLLIIQREKDRSIDELENEIVLRQESDTYLINDVQSGEALLKSLYERNISMEKSLRDAGVLHDGYMELIKALRLNPPHNEAHVQALETEVSLAHSQFADLLQHRLRLYTEGEKLDNVRKQQLTERINYFKCAREEVAVKKRQVARELKHLKAALGDRRRETKSRSRARRDREAGDRGTERAYSSDSDSSKESLKDITLTKPVIHFINALVRKVTYNEPIIKDTDKSLDDVKKRATAGTVASPTSADEAVAAPQPAPQSAPAGPTTILKRRPRVGEPGYRKASTGVRPGDSDAESVANSLQSMGAGPPVPTRAAPAGYAAPSIPANYLSRRRLSQDEMAQLKDSIKSLVNSEGSAAKDNFKAQLQKALALMLQKTESNSFDEFLDRYLQGQALLETLRSQQVLVDSRLSQLRGEHAELYAIWSDISFLAEEPINGAGPVSNQAPSADNDRYIDNQLFAKEVRLHHYQRLFDKSVHVVSEARTAIQHIMGLLTINAKLLAALPRTPVPILQSDQDMTTCLSWCEDRIIALNEALTMDANRPNAATNEEKSKPLSQRQADLAQEIFSMGTDKRVRRGQYKSQRKSHGAISKLLINSSDADGFVSTPRGVVVPPATKIDKIYDAKMTKVVNERDRHQDLSDAQSFYSRDTTAQNEVQRFLAEGLDLKKTKDMSRQAKVLMNKRSGRSQTYGLVLEELMKARGQSFQLSQAKSPSKDDVEEVPSEVLKPKTSSKLIRNNSSRSLGTAVPPSTASEVL